MGVCVSVLVCNSVCVVAIVCVWCCVCDVFVCGTVCFRTSWLIHSCVSVCVCYWKNEWTEVYRCGHSHVFFICPTYIHSVCLVFLCPKEICTLHFFLDGPFCFCEFGHDP